LQADQPWPAVSDRRLWIKADSVVDHCQLNLLRFAVQFDPDVSRSRMLYRVIESLLEHSEQTEREFLGQILRNALIPEPDFHAMLVRQLLTETRGRRREPELIESGISDLADRTVWAKRGRNARDVSENCGRWRVRRPEFRSPWQAS
jgi:hypothetical protein